MNTAMFIVGFCIFGLYVYFLIWSIFYNNKKQREETNTEYYKRTYTGPKAPKRKEGSQSRKKNYSRKFKQDV